MGNLEIDYYNTINYVNKSSGGGVERRENLYRHCGIPKIAFEGKRLLEAGPAGGETTKFYLESGCEHIDLLEPHDLSRKVLENALEGYDSNRYSIYSDTLESYVSDDTYDMLFAEGFLQLFELEEERKMCVDNLLRMSHRGSIIVLTCVDEVSFLVENMKRLIARKMVLHEPKLEKKVELLIPLFEKPLKQLSGCSRSARDWIYDNVFHPQPEKLFSIEEALRYFPESWKIQGSSPRFLPEYSFWKDIKFHERDAAYEQFYKKRHMLMWTEIKDSVLTFEQYEKMIATVMQIRYDAMKYENSTDGYYIADIVSNLAKLEDLFSSIDENMSVILNEIRQILSGNDFNGSGVFDISKYHNFNYAFGRGQQYLAMVWIG